MTVVTLPYRTQLAAGKSEDIGMVVADFDAIIGVINGGLTNDNFNAAAAIALSKLGITGTPVGTKFLKGDGSWSALPSGSGIVKYPKVTTTQVVNTVVKTDLFAGGIVIGAGAMGPNDWAIISAGGHYSNSSGADRQITMELQLGGTPIWNGGISDVLPRNAGVQRCWHFHGILQCMDSTLKQRFTGNMMIGEPTLPTTGLGPLLGGASSAMNNAHAESIEAVQDMSSAQTLGLMVQHSIALATVQMSCTRAVVILLASN
jgi:hypothetical protein